MFLVFYHRGFSGHAQLVSHFSQSALPESKLCIVFNPSLCFKMKADHSDFSVRTPPIVSHHLEDTVPTPLPAVPASSLSPAAL